MPDVVTYLNGITTAAREATGALRDLAAASDATPATREVARAGGETSSGITGPAGPAGGAGISITGKGALTLTATSLVLELQRLKGTK